jgi:hypothetical protein
MSKRGGQGSATRFSVSAYIAQRAMYAPPEGCSAFAERAKLNSRHHPHQIEKPDDSD